MHSISAKTVPLGLRTESVSVKEVVDFSMHFESSPLAFGRAGSDFRICLR